MNIGKFATRFVCSSPMDPELSITNSTSIFVQPSASTVELSPSPCAFASLSSPPTWWGLAGPHAHAQTDAIIIAVLIIAADHSPGSKRPGPQNGERDQDGE